ncbi:hypothetical protein IEQ34_012505 [Dendrobium chrysotoxum]|uniref:Uncharacterized protein n=1 Tax=Dendrobium chrysotoxum TaxID=161865 RepID=A0AAV7GSL7_DENCH|nr:hypothetical protein IEQ34_012505 [Dendrobium chrysotoxum]
MTEVIQIQQLHFRKSLKLDGMPRVKWLESKFNGNNKHHAFPLLEALYTKKSWFEVEVVAKGGCLFPCLIELYLRDCPKLQELPSLPPKLRKLEIDNIGCKTFNLLQGTSNGYIISSLAAIRNLIIRNGSDLIYLKGLKGLGTTKNS